MRHGESVSFLRPGLKQRDEHGYHITSREREVIELLVLGLSYQRISKRLAISIPTVKTHVSSIYKKLGVRNKIELMNVVRKR